jgi:hypothetical protein
MSPLLFPQSGIPLVGAAVCAARKVPVIRTFRSGGGNAGYLLISIRLRRRLDFSPDAKVLRLDAGREADLSKWTGLHRAVPFPPDALIAREGSFGYP